MTQFTIKNDEIHEGKGLKVVTTETDMPSQEYILQPNETYTFHAQSGTTIEISEIDTGATPPVEEPTEGVDPEEAVEGAPENAGVTEGV